MAAMNAAKRQAAGVEWQEASSSALDSEREDTAMDQDNLISENGDHDNREEGEFRSSEGLGSFRLLDGFNFAGSVMNVSCDTAFKNRQKMTIKDAAQEAVGFNEKTVRQHRNDFFKNKGYLTES